MTYKGVWKGVVFEKTMEDSNSQIMILSMSKYKTILEGIVRFEIPEKTDYYSMNLQGDLINNSLIFNKHTPNKSNCNNLPTNKLIFNLSYIDSTGYLEGQILNATDKKVLKKIVLFNSSGIVDVGEKKDISHAWFFKFIKEYSSGMIAPALREEERKNFQFQSIYFEPREWELMPEYYGYLKKMIKVVNGHTDLRIKVIGHTDWHGSDQYNEDLSKKRAEEIIQFLYQNGLSPDRIQYEYKGEKNPIENNETPEGRKKNRRVDFEFI